MTYNPDNWVIIKVKGDDPHYKVLGGWSGGYTTGNSWRMNSGIVEVSEASDAFYFKGSSGSVYKCGKQSYGLRMNNMHIWNQLKELHKDKVELLEEDVEWAKIDWIIT